jgi:protease-4
MGAFYREMTEEEKEKEQSLLDNFYNYFVGVVVRSRHLDEAEVRKLATGEVFMAETAKELGLVDELGDFDAALDLASQLGKVPRRITYVAPRRTLLQKVFSRFTAPLIEQIWDEARGNIRERAYYLGSPHIWTRL